MEARTYRANPWPFVIVAALVAGIAICALVFGDYGGAPEPGSRLGGLIGALLDRLPPPVTLALAYGLQACFLALAAAMLWRGFSNQPILVLTEDSATIHTVFGKRSIRWEDVRGTIYGRSGLITLKGDVRSITISLNVIIAPPGEVFEEVRRRLMAHGYTGA